MSAPLVSKSPSKLWLLTLAVLAVGVYIWLRYGLAQSEPDQDPRQKAQTPSPSGMRTSADGGWRG